MAETITRRSRRATLPLIGYTLATKLRATGFPAELFPAQVQAIREGLLDKSYDSWGFAAPTGTGKTFLSRLLALDAIEASSDAKILYLVPSKALVYEITQSLGESLKPAGIRVGLVSPQLTDLDRDEQVKLQETSLVVVTPEKADLLLRIGADFLSQVSLIVVDEAHHIEAGTRGALLEFYLWRLRRILSSDVRIIFLSALAPNIENLAQWMGKRPKGVVVDQRSTRMRVGVYKIETSGRQKHGVIEYVNTGRVTIVDRPESSDRRALVQLADRVSGTGPVLVVAKGKGECETLAHEMLTWLQEQNRLKTLSDAEIKSEPSQRLDSRLEREMYKDIGLRKLFPFRIAYHHAGLPPRVRTAIEDAIRKNLIDFVFSTTTLADGVNFPFSTVIIQSLALKEAPERGRPSRYAPVTPRTFWNIAGRAGRPGFDSEGQVLLFEPTLGLDKIAYTLEPYLNTAWRDIEPVRSALKTSLDELNKEITEGALSRDSLNAIALSDDLPRRVRGTVNLIRIALIHSKTLDADVSPEEIIDGTFAFRGANAEERRFALSIVSEQLAVVEEFLQTNGSLSAQLVAELGLSIETLSELRDYVTSLQNFQIQAFGKMFYGGTLNVDQAKYVVGPVSKRMAELEGRRLGGFYSDVIVHWLQGLPLAEAPRISKARSNSIEQLVSVMYTQVQYLLPWGLYAFDKLVELEATRRKISYNNEIKNLAYLADAGVPSFDALRLVDHEIERVDASRLAAYYRKGGGPALGVDVISWVASLNRSTLERYVRGIDQRRLDYDLHRIVEQLRLSR